MLWLRRSVIISVDADGFSEGADISRAFTGVILSSEGEAKALDGSVYAYRHPLASTGDKVFGHNLPSNELWYFTNTSGWNRPDNFGFRADFHAFGRGNLANRVSIDIICDDAWDIASLRAYDSSGTLLESISNYDGIPCTYGDVFRATIERDSFDIAYIIAGGTFGNVASAVYLDNLTANVIPEPATVLLFGLGGLAMIRRRRGLK